MIYFVLSRKGRTEDAPPERNHMLAGICLDRRDAVEHLKECRRRGGDDRTFSIKEVRNEDIVVPLGMVKE